MPFAHKCEPLGASGTANYNFVWHHDTRPIYFMDNHGAALWCWMRELAASDPFSLIHVDYHRDTGFFEYGQVLRSLPLNTSFADFLALRSPDPHRRGEPLVLWDNYLLGLGFVRPLGELFYGFVHQGIDGGIGSYDVPFRRAQWSQAVLQPRELGWVFRELRQVKGRLLINLDLDYFFMRLPANLQVAFSPAYIASLVGALIEKAPDAIWTVAWSPECCGGWQAARDMARVVDELLDAGFPFDELGVPT